MLTHPRQELYALGILYDDGHANANAYATSIEEVEPPPAFVIRPGRPRRHGHRRPARERLSLDSSFDFSNIDALIAEAESSTSYISPIQHRTNTSTVLINKDTQLQSLPPSTTIISTMQSVPAFPDCPPSPLAGDWTVLHTADADEQQQQHAQSSPTPPSEPETWILLGDDS